MKERKIPMRKCVGCMTSKDKRQLIRIAGYEGEVTVDATGKAKGRGVYVCPDQDCLAKAMKRNAINRGLQVEISSERREQLKAELQTVIENRVNSNAD